MKKRKKATIICIIALLVFGGYMMNRPSQSDSKGSIVHTTNSPSQAVEVASTPSSSPTLHPSHSKRHSHPKASKYLKKSKTIAKADVKNRQNQLSLGNQDTFEAGSVLVKLNGSIENLGLNPLSVGFRTGFLDSDFGLFADTTVLPIQITPKVVAATRLSLGIVNGDSEANLVVSGAEVFYFATSSPDVAIYTGVGLNLPLATGAEFGYDLFVGAEKKCSFFGIKGERLFIEAGLGSIKSDETDNDGLRLQAGYRFTF